MNPKLNLNYGIRYDYEGPLHNSNKDMSVFRPELTNSAGLALQGVQTASLYQRYWTSSARVSAPATLPMIRR